MKFLKIWAIALVATLGFISCEHENDWIEVDYSNDLVGAWTCFVEGYAEALGEIDKADSEAVADVFDKMDKRVDTINMSIVLKTTK